MTEMTPSSPNGGKLVSRAIEAMRKREAMGEKSHLIIREILEKLCLPGLFTADYLQELAEKSDGDAVEIAAAITALATSVLTQAGHQNFRIKDDIRSATIADVGWRNFKQALSQEVPRELDAFERLFSTTCENERLPTDAVEYFGQDSVSRVAAILRPVIAAIPSGSDLRRQARTLERKRSFHRAINSVFVDRAAESAKLNLFISDPDYKTARIFEVQGSAGSGKTTLIKRVLGSYLSSPRFPLVLIDFERPISSQNLLSTICRETLNTFFDLHLCEEPFFDALNKEIDRVSDLTDALRILQKVIEIQPSHRIENVLFFLDSVELFANDFGDVQQFLSILESVLTEFDYCKAITATRLSSFEYNIDVERVQLAPLEAADIIELCRASGLDHVRSRLVLRYLPERNPLLASLVIEWIRHENRISFSALKEDEKIHQYIFQKFAVDRIVSKIRSPILREVALSAVPLRRISNKMLLDETIFHSISLVFETRPGALFEQLRHQVIFFETHNEDLYLRLDVRALLLKLGRTNSDRTKTRTAREATLKHLELLPETQRTFEDAVDITYYKLCLGRPFEDLESTFNSALSAELLKYLDEYSPRGQTWLKRKSGKRLFLEDFSEAFEQDIRDAMIPVVQQAVYSGRTGQLENLLNSRRGFDTLNLGEFEFAAALLSFVRLKWSDALNHLHAAIGASENRYILEAGTLLAFRLAVFSGITDSRILDIADRCRRIRLRKGIPDDAGFSLLLELWINRLGLDYWNHATKTPSELKRLVSEVEQSDMRSSFSKLDQDALTELCLLGSLSDDGLLSLWIRSFEVNRLPQDDALQLLALLVKFGNIAHDRRGRACLARAEKYLSHFVETSAQSSQRTELRRLLSVLSQSLKPDFRPNAADVVRLRSIMGRTLGVFTGILIEQLDKEFPSLSSSDFGTITEIFQRPVQRSARSKGLVAAAVRKIYQDGKLPLVLETIRTTNVEGLASLRSVIDRWHRFFEI